MSGPKYYDPIDDYAARERARLERLNREKAVELSRARSMRSTLEGEYRNAMMDVENFRKKVGRLQEECRNAAVETPFGRYSMDSEAEKLKREEKRAESLATSGLRSEVESRSRAISAYESSVSSCSTSEALSRVTYNMPSVRLDVNLPNAGKMETEIKGKSNNLHKFAEYLFKLDTIIKDKSLENYRGRITEAVKSVDCFSPKSIAVLQDVVKEIEKEVDSLKASMAMHKAESEASEAALSRMKSLNEMSSLLKQFISAWSSTDAAIDYEALNESMIEECETVVKEISDLGYVSNANKSKLKATETDLKGCKRTKKLESTFEKLSKIKKTVGTLSDECKEEDAEHARFVEALEKYRENYEVYSKYPFETTKNLRTPNSFDFAKDSVGDLMELNIQLESRIEVLKQQDRSQKCKKEIQRDRKCMILEWSNEKATYYRTDAKGIIFEAEFHSGGGMTVSPRVAIVNDQKLLTKEEMLKTYSTCGWADSLSGEHKEINESNEAMYDNENCYTVKADRYTEILEAWGYSEEEIAEIGGFAEASGGRSAYAQRERHMEL